MAKVYFLDWMPVSSLPIDERIYENVEILYLSNDDIKERLDDEHADIRNIFMHMIMEKRDIRICRRMDGFFIFEVSIKDDKELSEKEILRLGSYISNYIKEYFGHSHFFHGYYIDKYINVHPVRILMNEKEFLSCNSLKSERIIDISPYRKEIAYEKAIFGLRWAYLRIGNSVFKGLNEISKSIFHSGLWWLIPLYIFYISIFMGYLNIYTIDSISINANIFLYLFIHFVISSLIYFILLRKRGFGGVKMAVFRFILEKVKSIGKMYGDIGWIFSSRTNRYLKLLSGTAIILTSYLLQNSFIYNSIISNYYDITLHSLNVNKKWTVYTSILFLLIGISMEILTKRTKKIKILNYGIAMLEYGKILDMLIRKMCRKANVKYLNAYSEAGFNQVQSALNQALKYEYHKLFNALIIVIILIITIYIYSTINVN